MVTYIVTMLIAWFVLHAFLKSGNSTLMGITGFIGIFSIIFLFVGIYSFISTPDLSFLEQSQIRNFNPDFSEFKSAEDLHKALIGTKKYKNRKEGKALIVYSISLMIIIFIGFKKGDEAEAKRKIKISRAKKETEERERENEIINQKIVESKKQIENLAMDKAIKYERENNRNPIDVSSGNVGYDIKSSNSAETRYIEVKGKSEHNDIQITPNEWGRAKELENNYYLYVVLNCKNESSELYIVQNPAKKLKPYYNSFQDRYIITKNEILDNSIL